MIRVQIISDNNQLRMAFAIRQKVFVEEQNVDHNIEYDEFERISTHLLAYFNNTPVGTARWRHTANGIKLERFAVMPSHRGKGIGSALLSTALSKVITSNDKTIYLHAQNQVISFYKKFGFVVEGEEFVEAEILHHKMIYKPVS